MKKGLLLTIITIFLFTLSGCKNDLENEITFNLIGDDYYVVEYGDPYIEPGFVARHDSTDLASFVTVSGTLDPATIGLYTLTYTLDYEGVKIVRTRIVNIGGFNTTCTEVDDTTLVNCSKVWTQYLNTKVTLALYLESNSTVDSDEVFSHIQQILAYYTIMSDKYKDYDGMMNVHEINNQAGNTVTVHEDLFELIEFTLEHQSDVNNLFNAALGPVLQVWHDYRDNCNLNSVCGVPSEATLNAANVNTDPTKVILDKENLTLTMEAGMSLDLGGVSKGFVSKKINEYLDSLDIHGYLLNNGESNISVGGEHPVRENKKFVIAITDPTYATQYYATIYLEDGEQLVTSGDYQKYFTVDGTRYHHIIHPTTLMPETYSRSVSIVTSDPALADLYSTAIFNMTLEEGKTFVNGIDGLEAVWYGVDGNLHFSENFETKHLLETFN